jgi:hypothetical protein
MQRTKRVIHLMQQVSEISTELQTIEGLFNNRRGRNPAAIEKIKSAIVTMNEELGPLMVETAANEFTTIHSVQGDDS